MKSLRVIGADAIVLIALLGLLAILSLAIARQTAQETERPRRTASSPTPTGWKAISLLLERRGYKVVLFNRQPRDWPKTAGVIITADPYISANLTEFNAETVWNKKQKEDALRWVDEGGTLFVFHSEENALTESLGLKLMENYRGSKPEAAATVRQAAIGLQGVETVRVGGVVRFEKMPPGALVLIRDASDKAVGFLRKRGRGAVICISDAAMLDNAHISKEDNARFAVQMFPSFAVREGAIVFDEFHQGYTTGDSLWQALGHAGQLVVWQLLAVTVLFCYSVSRRFGLSRPLTAPSRVSSEYVSSLARLYKRAKAHRAALESVFRTFRTDLCRALSLPDEADDSEVIERSANYYGGQETKASTTRLGKLLEECRETLQKEARQVSEREMLDRVQAIEATRKEMGLGRDA